MDDGGRSPSPGWVRRLADSTDDIPYYHVESGTVPLPYPFDYLSRTGMEGVTSRAQAKRRLMPFDVRIVSMNQYFVAMDASRPPPGHGHPGPATDV